MIYKEPIQINIKNPKQPSGKNSKRAKKLVEEWSVIITSFIQSLKILKTILCVIYGLVHILKSIKPCMVILNTKFRIVITIGKEDVEWD